MSKKKGEKKENSPAENALDHSEGTLLAPHERDMFIQISTLESPYSQRAQVLLTLDEGESTGVAGLRAGMTPRQARYWRSRFLQLGFDIFPDEVLDEVSHMHVPTHADAPDVFEGQQESTDRLSSDPLEEGGDKSGEAKGTNQPEKGSEKTEAMEKTKRGKKDKKDEKEGKGKKNKESKKGRKGKKNKRSKKEKKGNSMPKNRKKGKKSKKR